uniref:3-phosphoinositide-dependent protein kinase 2-like n=1 Tax=Rhizophora mucronata TaxID=61149 RepID=A0A2P2MHE9_RHIMU
MKTQNCALICYIENKWRDKKKRKELSLQIHCINLLGCQLFQDFPHSSTMLRRSHVEFQRF